jgi:hypothetical protein
MGASCRWRAAARGVLAGFAALALGLLPAVPAGSDQGARMKRIEPRELVRTVSSKYAIFQGGDEIGSEVVTRNDYNDNSVQYQSEVVVKYIHGVEMKMVTDLLLEEESYFPMKYHMTKDMTTAEVVHDMGTDIEWYANVAVFHNESRSVVDTFRVVLPTGTAVIDFNVVHHLYVPLYWYDGDLGGVQGFNVVDPSSRKLSSATLRLQRSDTVTVAGRGITADRFEFTRDKQSSSLHVDADGRIVKFDQGFLVFELTEWSESLVQGQ